MLAVRVGRSSAPFGTATTVADRDGATCRTATSTDTPRATADAAADATARRTAADGAFPARRVLAGVGRVLGVVDRCVEADGAAGDDACGAGAADVAFGTFTG